MYFLSFFLTSSKCEGLHVWLVVYFFLLLICVIRKSATVPLRVRKDCFWFSMSFYFFFHNGELWWIKNWIVENLIFTFSKVKDEVPLICLEVKPNLSNLLIEFGVSHVVRSKLDINRTFNYWVIGSEKVYSRPILNKYTICYLSSSLHLNCEHATWISQS